MKAGLSGECINASVHHEPNSSLMEYPKQRRAEGGRREGRWRRKSRGEEGVEEEEDKD